MKSEKGRMWNLEFRMRNVDVQRILPLRSAQESRPQSGKK